MEDENGMSKYISCVALKKAFARVGIHIRDEAPAPGNEIRNLSTLIGDVVKSVPAADVAPVVHGQWLDNEDYMFCSICGIQWNYCDNDTKTFNYCPNCGAKMDGDSHASD